MPDNQITSPEDFSRFDQMSDEELRQILRADASKPAGEESDNQCLLYIMEVLAKRSCESGSAKDPAAAWNSFQENYMPQTTSASAKHPWLYSLAAAAAVLVLLIGGTLTARAFGFDIWCSILQWSEQTFHFGQCQTTPSAPITDAQLPCASLQELLDAYQVTKKLVPTWLPEGYEEISAKIQETPRQRLFVASYQHNENEIKMRISDYLGSYPTQVEQSSFLLELYTVNDIDYYIFTDNNNLQAVWITDRFECVITGPVSLEELKAILDSIEKG